MAHTEQVTVKAQAIIRWRFIAKTLVQILTFTSGIWGGVGWGMCHGNKFVSGTAASLSELVFRWQFAMFHPSANCAT